MGDQDIELSALIKADKSSGKYTSEYKQGNFNKQNKQHNQNQNKNNNHYNNANNNNRGNDQRRDHTYNNGDNNNNNNNLGNRNQQNEYGSDRQNPSNVNNNNYRNTQNERSNQRSRSSSRSDRDNSEERSRNNNSYVGRVHKTISKPKSDDSRGGSYNNNSSNNQQGQMRILQINNRPQAVQPKKQLYSVKVIGLPDSTSTSDIYELAKDSNRIVGTIQTNQDYISGKKVFEVEIGFVSQIDADNFASHYDEALFENSPLKVFRI